MVGARTPRPGRPRRLCCLPSPSLGRRRSHPALPIRGTAPWRVLARSYAGRRRPTCAIHATRRIRHVARATPHVACDGGRWLLILILLCSNAVGAQHQSYCSTNGFKQEVKCVVGGTSAGNSSSSEGLDPSTSYITFQSCQLVPGDFMSFVRFEVVMVLIFLLSFSFVTKRKRRLQAIQQYRIAQYL